MSPPTRLRLFYFLYYGSVGASLPYLGAYLRGLGFTGGQIGNVLMLGPLLAAPVALSWAAAADRLGSPARALRMASLWTLGSILLLPLARTPVAVGAVLLAQGLADRAVVPLVDSVSMEYVRAEGRLSYARIRLFGSLGYVALSLGVGLLLWLRGDRPADPAVPLAVVACVGGYALSARELPSPPRSGERPRLRELLALVRSGPLLWLLAVAMVHWGATAPFHVLFGLHVRDLGLAPWVTGLATSAGVGAEIAALLLFPRLEARLSTRGLFALAFAGSALRWLLTWRVRSAPATVAVQLLHGLTFGVFWGASVRAMGRLVPARLRSSGQALFSAVVFGGGNALGYQLSGRGLEWYGSVAPLFAWAAALECAALAAALALLGDGARRGGGRGSAPGQGDAPPETHRA
jgi:MFS transporter, PPP family, 3-phenylpropionic acid transporter